MVVRGGLFWLCGSSKTLILLPVVLLISQLFFIPVQAQPVSDIRVLAGNVEDALIGETVEVPITLEHNLSDPEIAGFDISISYDTELLTFDSARAGELFLDCGWEHWRVYTYPDGIVKLIGVAEIAGNPDHPNCLFANTAGNLAYLTFTVIDDYAYECFDAPLRFIWGDCSDNILVNDQGEAFVSDRVFSFRWYDSIYEEIQADSELPTYLGTPDLCIDPDKPVLTRMIDFVNGNVDIICANSVDDRGDLNLNGLANEIADWVIFTYYFIDGLAAFTIDADAQAATTDINNDGEILTLRDYVYLYRVIIGDVSPYPLFGRSSAIDTAVFVQDLANKTIS
jgi:hypothetical protein